MRWRQDRDIRVFIVPSDMPSGCYHWIIRSPDGRCLMRSPYTFATKAAARLSGECWKQEMTSGSTGA